MIARGTEGERTLQPLRQLSRTKHKDQKRDTGRKADRRPVSASNRGNTRWRLLQIKGFCRQDNKQSRNGQAN